MKKKLFKTIFQIPLFLILFSGCGNPLEKLNVTKTEKETATYEVHHRRERIDGTFDENEDEIQTIAGYVGDMTNAEPLKTPLYEDFIPQYIQQKEIKKEQKIKTDENEEIIIRTTIIIEYYRKNYKYTFKDGNEVIKEIKGKYQQPIPKDEFPVPEKEDVFFSGWNPDTIPETFVENITFTAVWTSSDTDYHVIHKQQNILNDEYTTVAEETKTAPAGRETKAIAKNYPGFTAKPFSQTKVIEDGSTVVIIYYDRNIYTLSFNTMGGNEIESVQGKYQSAVPDIPIPKKQGFTFNGWSPELSQTFLDNIEYTAQWISAKNIQYTVEHYLQTVDLSNYEKDSEQSFDGEPNTVTKAVPKNYEGFTAKDFNQEIINADGSTVVKIYYNRNTYDITFISEDVEYRKLEARRYGSKLTNPGTPTRKGYVFDGWSPSLTETVTTQTEYVALWQPRTDTEYTVKAFLQKADYSGYEERSILVQNLKGTTGELTNAQPVEIEGFIPKMEYEQLPIAGDGSTVINIYYDIAD